MISVTDYEAMRQKWHADQARHAQRQAQHEAVWRAASMACQSVSLFQNINIILMLGGYFPAREEAAATAQRHKLAHWRHRADEVCGYVPEDVQ